MNAQEVYAFHQTPASLAKDLLAHLTLEPTDRLLEPFKGEGAFYSAFPAANPKLWAEIEQGRDYKDVSGEFDWVITNPPFQIQITPEKRVNAFWPLLDYYSTRAQKGIAFLGNDRCLMSLTPTRLELLKSRGWHLQKVVVCSVKKWRGRYYFVVFTKEPCAAFDYLLASY